MPFTIKDSVEDILPYLPDVRKGADTAKEELGFLPEAAYRTFATTGKLFVATATIDGKEIYAGHLVFGGLFPQARIFQLFVDPAFRGHGLARRLLTLLKERLTAQHWLSIVAKVAGDLAANSVWGRMGFRIVRTKAGGVARNRQINVRVLDLESPSLLTLMGISARESELRFAERYSQRPIYLFDLNVLFDVIRRRPRSDAATKVVWAGMNNSIRLMVAEEFAKELLRTSKSPNNDPVLAFAARADCLSQPSETNLRPMLAKLAPAIFPERHRQGALKEQDWSDLKHISTAIYHRAAGFITSENAILRASQYLLEVWNLDVIGVEEFATLVEARQKEADGAVAAVSSGMLRARRNIPDDLPRAREFIQAAGASSAFVEDALACQGTQAQWLLIVDDQDGAAGFAKWTVFGGTKRTTDLYLAVDETNPVAESILDYFLDAIPRELSGAGPTLVRLNILAGQVATRQTAIAMGFRPPIGAGDSHLILQRLAVGRIISSENWPAMRQSLISVASLYLPQQVPTHEDMRTGVVLKNGDREVALSLSEIERILSPVLLLFPGRDGVIVPIREHFARDLIGASPQLSILAPPEAILRRERVYISAPKTLGQMKTGTPILFYESQKGTGRGCVFAVARITESRIVTKADALGKVLQRGVLDRHTLEKRSVGRKVTETSFDNIFIFKTPVSLKRLRELECVDGSNLVSARSISFEKLVAVVKEGRVNG
ncbi:hypothetical protein GCM10011611_38670 [Aliidongia dinghuensis]|uniref:N-acetyltransferase domain-containing protein n=1 Tax=Aliidongia dinghuensis TaxID=1867774 RepID=A0A8J2YWJ7_9PROT|nr:GNAT family N-acetyltransferase [Aliidongia dinghuensis]GGF28849.1 hypothetical protein GCM10011611_38670 [Aliidongia dinghuensis]